ncbi:MAG: hypothetical protein V4613_00270 [Bacteroidota bacterium]
MNDFKIYNKAYPGKLWLATLTLTPLLLLVESILLNGKEIGSLGSLLGIYCLVLAFEIMCSIPVGIVVIVLYFILIEREVSALIIKGIIISTVVLGIFVTFFIMSNGFEWTFSSLYSFTAIVAGLLLRVSPRNQN